MVCGLQPNLHMLNNECSVTMKYFIREAGTKHQLLPPGLHQSLIAEMEIQTFKPPLIAELSSCNSPPLPSPPTGPDNYTGRNNLNYPAPWPNEPPTTHRGKPKHGIWFKPHPTGTSRNMGAHLWGTNQKIHVCTEFLGRMILGTSAISIPMLHHICSGHK